MVSGTLVHNKRPIVKLSMNCDFTHPGPGRCSGTPKWESAGFKWKNQSMKFALDNDSFRPIFADHRPLEK